MKIRVTRSILAVPYTEASARVRSLFARLYALRLLEATGGNVSEAARRAGLQRARFRKLLTTHGVSMQKARALIRQSG